MMKSGPLKGHLITKTKTTLFYLLISINTNSPRSAIFKRDEQSVRLIEIDMNNFIKFDIYMKILTISAGIGFRVRKTLPNTNLTLVTCQGFVPPIPCFSWRIIFVRTTTALLLSGFLIVILQDDLPDEFVAAPFSRFTSYRSCEHRCLHKSLIINLPFE